MSEEFEDLYGSQYLAASDLKKPFTSVVEEVDKQDFARQGERQKIMHRPRLGLRLERAKRRSFGLEMTHFTAANRQTSESPQPKTGYRVAR